MPDKTTVELPDLGPPAPPPPLDLAATPPPAPRGEVSFGPPLRGITLLAVEDSRFASEALRLMCHRLGARLRRAETLQAAHAHLRLYRPDVVIIDLGLPDGRGEGLIRELRLTPHAPILLGTSGDIAGRSAALAAGADGFLDKPLSSLAAFQTLLMRHLPDRLQMLPPQDTPLAPDRLALRDDLAHAANLIDSGAAAQNRSYLTGFLSGVARHAGDATLAAAADGRTGLDALRRLLDWRLAHAAPPFGRGEG